MSWTLSVFLFSIVLADRPPDPTTLPLPPEPLRSGFSAIDEADLRAWVGFLASAELQGRSSGEQGYDVASRFCATLFARYGLKPAGKDGTFFQEFEILQNDPDEAASFIEVKDSIGTERFPLKENLALGQPQAIDWTARVAFAGNGHGAQKDSPGDYQGLPVKERIVLVLPTSEWTSFQKKDAEAAGAEKVVVVSEDAVKRKLWIQHLEVPCFEAPPSKTRGSEIVYVSRKVANRILRSKGLTVEKLLSADALPPRLDLEGVEARIAIPIKETRARTRNVAGILEGSDPSLREEVVAIGAHLDHIGHKGNEIFHGADDDASGSSGVIALAKAFSESPARPARSILFLLFAAEEKGLWGSRYFVDHPVVPIQKIFAEIQLDMIGRNEESHKGERAEENTNTVHLVGGDKRHKTIYQPFFWANRFVGLDFEYDENDVFGSSDQFSFARKGIPTGFLFTGLHGDYHHASDTADKINYPKMARIVRLAFATAYDLADRKGPLPPARRL